jgi:hypothetical protein
VTWRSPLSAKFCGHFSPIVPLSAAGFTSVASGAGGLLWRKVERSKSLVLFQVGGLKCRWQRYTVKPSCWECSTTVEQAETLVRVVVPIEEEEEEVDMNGWWEVIHTLIFKNLASACRFQFLCEKCTGLWVSASDNNARMWSSELYSVFQQSLNPAENHNAVICNPS